MNETFTIKEISLILGITITCLIMAVMQTFSLVLAILPGFILLLMISLKKGFTKKQIMQAAKTGFERNKAVGWLLIFIGMLLPSWYYAGTIHDINLVFLSLISPDYFLLVTFMITTIMSLTIGSSVGSLSIVGVPIMASAHTLHIPVAIVAGALVSGAFVGDRTSPLSSSFQLLSHSLEMKIDDQLKKLIPSLLINLVICSLIFYLIDIQRRGNLDLKLNEQMAFWDLPLGEIAISFIPPIVILVVLTFISKNMKLAFVLSIFSSVIILLARDTSVSDWLYGIWNGANGLGGVSGMLPFILFIIVVGVYCQIIEDTNMIQPYIHRIFMNKSSLGINTAQTVGVAGFIALISPNQSFPVILTGRSLLPHWEKYFNKGELARILADSTVLFAGLVPWSLLAILCSTILNVKVIHYLPYAFFLWIPAFVTILLSYIKSVNLNNKRLVKQH